MRRALFVLGIIGILFTQSAAAEIPEGYSPQPVNDFAGLIDPVWEARLTSLAAELEAKTGAEMAVVVIRSLEGEDIEGYANRLLVDWGIGKKGRNNGVLFLVAAEDRRMRIEVGYGLEPILPDGYLGGILDDMVLPFFKDGRYGEGIYTGSLAVAERIAEDAGVELTGTVKTRQGQPVRERGVSPLRMIGMFLFFIFFLFFAVRHPFIAALLFFGRGGLGGFGGGFGGGIGGGSGGFGGFGGGLGGGGGSSRGW